MTRWALVCVLLAVALGVIGFGDLVGQSWSEFARFAFWIVGAAAVIGVALSAARRGRA